MELKDKYKLLLQVFDAKDGETFSQTIERVLMSPRRNEYFDKYVELFPDLTEDELRSCWQFWFADRDVKKQDYTSTSLAKLCARLLIAEGGKTLYDCCAGSGSLTLAVWHYTKDITVYCEELDSDVIPLLLFNLAIRNMQGEVRNGDALTGITERAWILKQGAKYSSIEEPMFMPEHSIKADLAISNPPYNIRVNGKKQNFGFVDRCLSVAPRAVLILPAGCSTSKDEMEDRKRLIEGNKFIASVLMPGRIFESTGVITNVYLLGDNKGQGVALVDASECGSVYVREQRGEGSASHTQRIYKKEMAYFSDTNIEAVCSLCTCDTEVSKITSIEQLREHEYSLMFGNYKEVCIDSDHTMHRDFNDIVRDINKINRMRNCIKITVNKVWAKDLGLESIIELHEQSKQIVQGVNQSLAQCGVTERLAMPDYIASSNSKELKIVQVDKEFLSPVLISFFQFWNQQIRTMNDMETLLFQELRDSMLEPLMTGRIDINQRK